MLAVFQAKQGGELPDFLHGRLRYVCHKIFIMNPFHCPFHLLEATHITWLMVSSFLCNTSNQSIKSSTSHMNITLTTSAHSSSMKDPGDYTELTGRI